MAVDVEEDGGDDGLPRMSWQTNGSRLPDEKERVMAISRSRRPASQHT